MAQEPRLFTSESVSEGHPDKVCDGISDAVLDEVLKQDPNGRVACETLTSRGLVVVTGEIRHHDALTILRRGCNAIALGHWASERPVLGPLARRLKEALPGLSCMISSADRDPFRSI